MTMSHSPDRSKKPRKPSPLMVRLDDESKAYLSRAAEPGQGGANDHNAAGALKGCYQVRCFFFCRGIHDLPPAICR